ncbi:toll/interleukin-1 receptor domain-containing protein [Chryseobacterium sp. ES2]|uniref:Toll/interleukin-1 receptor domain-containing protein n=1 Tax=Chryseobacterium metallicongregator TaxID=3073042 RepID=A0ABU1E1A7_9FLAO|nr:toll/interleukin-1 receptor domain-containing protein [Chryseobacterium sp. ES2]MDR4951561.1 toll/interleukin-1 receptor domain-containing protein [Chryseobacterium sp. ES2]
MNLVERVKNDFGKNFESLGYQAKLKQSGVIEGYEFMCVFNIKDYYQVSVVNCNILDENYKKIPKSLLAMKITEEEKKFSFYQLQQENPPFVSIPHNRNVYIYCNEVDSDVEEMNEFFLQHNLRLIIRDKKYREMEKADFFISHDSGDKESVARPLYEALKERGFKVWYDEYSLNIGDSLTESIMKGISESKHGILILSKKFLSNEKWVKFELQALLTKQVATNSKVILPVWHGISEEDLQGNYWLLDKLGGNTDKGIEKLADKLKESFQNS